MEPTGPNPRVVRFGVFELDRLAGELRRDGVRVRLQEQPLRVLEALLAQPGEPVTRDTLRQRLWPDDTFVDFDNGLNRAINRLRAALGDEASNPRFIETLERRGYRFIAPVEAPTAASRPAAERITSPEPPPAERPRRRRAWLGASAVAVALAVALAAVAALRERRGGSSDRPAIRSLAVLPLANLTGDPGQEYFSDGMTEALITNLASLPGLRVISRQSVMRYKGSEKPLPEIARELGVDGVIEGSVVRSGGRVRLTAQLIHGSTDAHVWARSYERKLEDVLALQAELSRAVAEEVRVTVGAQASRRLTSQPPVDPEAYDAYLLGRHHWNLRTAEALERALGHFKAAVARDPAFALAHAGIALAQGPRHVLGYVPPGSGLAEHRAAAERALELDPGLGDARAALAVVHAEEWRWDLAEAEFRRAIEADPGSSVSYLWYGWMLHALGRFEESLVHRRRALELDPLNAPVNRAVARELGSLGRDAEAVAQWARTLELGPDSAPSLLSVALLHFERARTAEGQQYLRRARSVEQDDPATVASLAVVSAVAGDAGEARRLLRQLEGERRYVSPVLRAYVHAALGEDDAAFVLLDQACAAKDPMLIGLGVGEAGAVLRLSEPRLATVRTDPRFVALLRKMGVPHSFRNE
jgi:TolB-like protein/DNA-binding winged helix-turn-helix (wHTH) protein/Tfp pilus assembly protein PilF